MAELPQKKKKQSWGDMRKLLCLNCPENFLKLLDYSSLNILKIHDTEVC